MNNNGMIHKAELIAQYLVTQNLNASVNLTPEYNLAQNIDKTVFVYPREKKLVRETRSNVNHTFIIDICLLQKVRENQIAELITEVEDLATKLLKQNFDNAIIEEIEHSPLMDGEELRQKRLFVSIISLTLSEVL